MPDGKCHKKRRLAGLLVSLPLFAGWLVFFSITQYQGRVVELEQSRFGESSARQVAAQVANHVIEDNLLSLNVILAQLTRNEQIGRASCRERV